MGIMTLLLDLTPDLALDRTLQEAVQIDPLHWISFGSEGRCTWLDARRLIDRVGIEASFEYLVLSAGNYDAPDHRFAQTTGGPARYLLEIAEGNTVATVSPAGVGEGEQVWVTAESSPWCRSSADENVLLPAAEVTAIAYSWVTAGILDPAYELRPVQGDYAMPQPLLR